ncbi:MAG: hypothetical protein NUV34_08600, partial [Sulfuricaulis sp.]|nr:hypothetical protein [Sulfuricaulis sp.]
TLLALGSAAGLWEVELDPRSADFAKGRIGPLRYDFWTGYSQFARLAAQVATGETKSTRTGEVYKLENRAQPFGRFIRGKLNPTAGAGIDQLTGSDYKGDSPPGPLDRIIELFSPISVQEIVDAYNSYGWEMALATLPGFVGAGVSVYEPTAEDALNEIARHYEYTDAYGNKVTGKDFRELPPGARDAVLKENPELATQRIAESSQKVQLAQERTQKLIDDQRGSDRLLADRTLTSGAWRDDLGDRKNELRVRKDEIYNFAGTEPGDDPVLDGYYKAIDKSEGPDGKANWDQVDRYVEKLPRSEQKYIEDNTGLIRIDTPQVREFDAEQTKVEKSGYFDRSEESWKNVQYYFPDAKKYDSYEQWQGSYRKWLVDGWVKDYGMTPELAQREATKYINDLPEAQAMEGYAKQWRYEWAIANPEAAYLAWKWDYYTPTDEMATWLDQVQRVGK